MNLIMLPICMDTVKQTLQTIQLLINSKEFFLYVKIHITVTNLF